MIDPFEYEKNKTQVNIRDSAVKDDRLDVSVLDRPLQKLNHFESESEHSKFLRKEKPFTNVFEKEVGRVPDRDTHKSAYQGEGIGQKGSMVSEYDTVETMDVGDRENASVLIHKYLDKEVNYVLPMLNTIDSVENIRVTAPIMTPGITFIDSRKNMATRLN
jgi:hypothetical protein